MIVILQTSRMFVSSSINLPRPLHPNNPVPGQAAPYRVWLQRPLACDGGDGGMRAGQSLWSINQVYNFQLLPHWCGCQKKSKGAAILFYVLFKYNKNLATYSGLPYLHDQGCFTPALLLNTEHTHCQYSAPPALLILCTVQGWSSLGQLLSSPSLQILQATEFILLVFIRVAGKLPDVKLLHE